MPHEFDPARFASTVRQRLRDRRMTQAALAEAVGVTAPSVSDWLNQKSSPSAENVNKTLDVLGIEVAEVSVDYSVRERREHGRSDAQRGIVMIPHDGEAAAGDGRLNDPARASAHAYPKEVVQQLTGFAPLAELRSFLIVGDSLAPEIGPNTPAIYRQMSRLIGDGLYVLRVDDGEVVKRVQRLPGGMLILSSFNPAYQPAELKPLKDADTPGTFRETHSGEVTHVQVVGKVVFYPKPA